MDEEIIILPITFKNCRKTVQLLKSTHLKMVKSKAFKFLSSLQITQYIKKRE